MKKYFKRVISIALSSVMVFYLLPTTFAAAEDGVQNENAESVAVATELDAEPETENEVTENFSETDLEYALEPVAEETEIAAEQTGGTMLLEGGADENKANEFSSDGTVPISADVVFKGGWIKVSGTITVSTRIVVSGDVHLILADGCEFNANAGITVAEGNSLTISSQSEGTGKLTVGASTYTSNVSVPDGMAGIGGDNGNAGTITINGGNITVIGGLDAAGIGGGKGGTGGTININGGTVTAYGGKGEEQSGKDENGNPSETKTYSGGAGIGGGKGGTGGNINITGGTVNINNSVVHNSYGAGIGGGAYADGGTINISNTAVVEVIANHGAGIGGGVNGSGGTITISGEKVTATGGNDSAAIGGGENTISNNEITGKADGGNITIDGGEIDATGGYGAAAIGGGHYGASGNISISGGSVTAKAGAYASGIGAGNCSVCENYIATNNGTIKISGGTVTATSGSEAAIGGGHRSEGGTIIISGGIVTATSAQNANGIGSGNTGDRNVEKIEDGTDFSTGENGTAVIKTTSIGVTDYTTDKNLSAIIIIDDGSTGDDSKVAVVYGNQTVTDVSSLGVTKLTVTTDASLTVAMPVSEKGEDVYTVDNSGTVVKQYANENETKIQVLSDSDGNKTGEIDTIYISSTKTSTETTLDSADKQIKTVTTEYLDKNRQKPKSIVTEYNDDGSKETITNEYDETETLTKTVAVDKNKNTTTTTYSSDGTKTVVKTDSDGNVTENITYYSNGSYKDENFTPVLTEGDGTTYDATSALTFRSDDEIINFLYVKVDGVTVDAANYDAVEGSIIVTLKKSYLDTLKLGAHTIDIVSTNGDAMGNFTITKTSVKDETKKDTTKTTEKQTTENTTTENVTTENTTMENVKTEAQPTVISTDKTKLTSSNTDSSPETGDDVDFVLILMLMGVGFVGGIYAVIGYKRNFRQYYDKFH